jgi:15-cis-phytoene desaturase
MRRVAIAGGGLAGLTCAKYLVDAGCEVTLIEGLPYLGGRASTYRDSDGDWVEQGLHLFFGTYSELKKLLREVGQEPDSILFWMSEMRLQDPEGPAEALYGINPLHEPLKTVRTLLGQNDYLGPLDKLSLLPLIAPALLPFQSLRELYDNQTVVDWWSKVSRDRRVLERFIRPFCRGIQFSDPEQFSAFNFLGWLHHIALNLPQALLGGYRGARDEIFFQPLARYLVERGATLRTGVELREVLYRADSEGPGRVAGFGLARGELLQADHYVVAIPVWAFVPLIPGPLRVMPFFSQLASLPVAPAISIQLWLDRPVVQTEHFTLVAHSHAAVYQDLSRNAYPHPAGSRLSFIVAPAEELLAEPDEVLVRRVVETLGRVQPAMREAKVLKSVVLKHRQHLVRPLPGAMSRRPTQATPIPNLSLAGDWTQQEYFGSQEGAVRGGKACARQVLRALEGARPQPPLQEEHGLQP